MKRTRIITVTLTLVLAFFFILGSMTKGEKPPWADNLPSEPIFRITQNGTDIPVDWEDHAPNPRFANYDSGTPTDETDDIVLDKETGLVWERSPSAEFMNWQDAVWYCYSKYLGGRKGWRMPTVEELASLLEPNQNNPALPVGHPFINVGGHVYWTSTIRPGHADISMNVEFGGGNIGDDFWSDPHLVWCVRGGQGPVIY